MPEPSSYALLCIVLLTFLAAAWDLKTGEIPNRLVALGAVLGVLVPLLLDFPGSSAMVKALLSMFAGFVLVSVVPGLLYRAGGMGGGDLKLLAAIGLVLGPLAGLEVELFAFCLAALYAPIKLIWEGKLMASVKMIAAIAVRPLLPKHRRPAAVEPEELTSLRFGPAIFGAALLTALHQLGASAP
jgi:prepilin peptidase CpaA